MFPFDLHESRCGLTVRRQAGKQKDLGSIRIGSPFSSKIVVYGQFYDFTHTLKETLKWPTQLPALMRGYSGGDSVARKCLI